MNILSQTFFAFILRSPVLAIAYLIFIVLAITIHEWAHAWTATKFGDDTPRLMGRLNLDPRSHIDPLGGLMFILVGFGWGKPVLYNPLRLKRRVDELLIALAGPIINLIAALIFNLIIIVVTPSLTGIGWASNLVSLLAIGSQVNIILAAFNLIPIPPLDGSSIIAYFFPGYRSIFAGQFGLLILLFLLFVPIGGQSLIGYLINPLLHFFSLITFAPF